LHRRNALASARRAIPLDRLLRETALNVLILSRIISNLLESPDDRDRIEGLADQLIHRTAIPRP
jgi:hypothetical protein